MRQALELSTTMAPAAAAIGLHSRLTPAGVLERTMSTPANASGRSGSTGHDRAHGELAFDQQLSHHFADGARGADHGQARLHGHLLFNETKAHP
jgi:hypothetical protein